VGEAQEIEGFRSAEPAKSALNLHREPAKSEPDALHSVLSGSKHQKQEEMALVLMRLKSLGQNALSIFSDVIRDCWRLRLTIRDYVQAVTLLVRYGLPDIVLVYGWGLGDDLMGTAALRELKARGRGPLWMISNTPELFEGTNDASHILPINGPVEQLSRILPRRFRRLVYDRYDPIIADRVLPPTRHYITEICARAGITGHITLRPHLVLTEQERETCSWATGRVAIQSAAVGPTAMYNKQWSHERFQAVVDALANDYKFVQLGTINDRPLRGVDDLRGQTSIRQTAAILSHTRLFVGTVGFLMHLARAVECPSVIVYGGREAPWQSGYICNINFYSDLSCAPCWRNFSCEYNRMCMSNILTEDVVRGVSELAKRPRGPLHVETAEL
jgi:hypothetical protein